MRTELVEFINKIIPSDGMVSTESERTKLFKLIDENTRDCMVKFGDWINLNDDDGEGLVTEYLNSKKK